LNPELITLKDKYQ
jgi:hypothetical protein